MAQKWPQTSYVLVSWLGEIAGIDVDALSEFETKEGGIGYDLADIQIERIMVDEPVLVTVEYAAYSQAKDRLLLSMKQPENNVYYFESSWRPQGVLSFPAFHIDVDPVVVDYDAIRVRIGSDQTALEDIEVKSIFAGFLAAYVAASEFPTPTD